MAKRILLGDRAATAGLVLLVSLPFLIFVPRALFGGSDEMPGPPRRWVNTLLITAGTWPIEDGVPAAGSATLELFTQRASGFAQCYAPSDEISINAASAFSGLFPSTSGVQRGGDQLSPEIWTLVTGARNRGARTAAFLEEPLATSAGIFGFDTLVESPELGPAGLASAVIDDWLTHPDELSFVWVHLSHAGPSAVVLEDLLRGLTETPGGLDERRRAQTLIVVTAFGSGAEVAEDNDSGFRVPLYVEMPADIFAGRRARGAAMITDIAEVICESADLDRPKRNFDARRSLTAALGGAEFSEWSLLVGRDWHVLRRNNIRLSAPGLPPARPREVTGWDLKETQQDRGFTRSKDTASAGAVMRLYQRTLAELPGGVPKRRR